MRPVVVVVGNVDGDNLPTIGPARASFGIFRQTTGNFLALTMSGKFLCDSCSKSPARASGLIVCSSLAVKFQSNNIL